MKRTVEIAIDQTARAMYARLSREEVYETRELREDLIVDLDRHGVVVGVEMLRLGEKIPWDLINESCHIRSELRPILDAIEAANMRGISLSHGTDGVAVFEDDLEKV